MIILYCYLQSVECVTMPQLAVLCSLLVFSARYASSQTCNPARAFPCQLGPLPAHLVPQFRDQVLLLCPVLCCTVPARWWGRATLWPGTPSWSGSTARPSASQSGRFAVQTNISYEILVCPAG